MRQIRLFDTPEALGQAVATDIADRFAAKTGPFLLGCPGGRSPRPVYAALADLVAKSGLDVSRLTIVMMDDYLIETPTGFDHVDANAHYSCRRFARAEIQAVLNAGRAPGHRILDANVWFPDPHQPAAYDQRIDAAGGIDFFLLASGAGDGHVAFNPPGSSATSQTRIVTLASQTRRDNLLTFPDFPDVDAVPRHGLTVGIATIARSRATGMVVWGGAKRTAFRHLSQVTAYDPGWPATVWAACPDATLYADHAAAEGSPG